MLGIESGALLLVGFIGGFLGSEVGAGTMITLPALLFLGLPPAAAVATNIFSAWVTNLVAGYEYWRNKKIQYDIVFYLAPMAFVGSIIGARLITIINPAQASSIVAVLFAIVFLIIFIVFRKGMSRLQTGSQRYNHTRKVLAGIGAFVLGVYGGFFAVGVTTLFLALIIGVLGRDFTQAAADAVAISAIFLLGSLVQFASTDLIQYAYAIPLAVGSGFGAYYGSRNAMKRGNRWLRGLVLVLVLIAIARLSYSAFAK